MGLHYTRNLRKFRKIRLVWFADKVKENASNLKFFDFGIMAIYLCIHSGELFSLSQFLFILCYIYIFCSFLYKELCNGRKNKATLTVTNELKFKINLTFPPLVTPCWLLTFAYTNYSGFSSFYRNKNKTLEYLLVGLLLSLGDSC